MARKPESALQKACIELLSILSGRTGFLFFAPMNEGAQSVATSLNATKEQRARVANHFRNMGAVAGASDLIVIANGRAYFVELKTETGRQSDAQVRFEKAVNRAGAEYAVVRSTDELQAQLKEWRII